MAVRWETEGPVDVWDWVVDVVAGGVGVVESLVERVRSSDWVVARERVVLSGMVSVMTADTVLVILELVISCVRVKRRDRVLVMSSDGVTSLELVTSALLVMSKLLVILSLWVDTRLLVGVEVAAQAVAMGTGVGVVGIQLYPPDPYNKHVPPLTVFRHTNRLIETPLSIT